MAFGDKFFKEDHSLALVMIEEGAKLSAVAKAVGKPLEFIEWLAGKKSPAATKLKPKPKPTPRVKPDPICTYPGCDKPHDARGLCKTHYKKWCYHNRPGEKERLKARQLKWRTKLRRSNPEGWARFAEAARVANKKYQAKKRNRVEEYKKAKVQYQQKKKQKGEENGLDS